MTGGGGGGAAGGAAAAAAGCSNYTQIVISSLRRTGSFYWK